MARKIEIVTHNPEWSSIFEAEAGLLLTALEGEAISVEHIGSTAVSGLCAKAIIDFLIEVKKIENVDDYNQAMLKTGYQARGEWGIAGRRFFFKDTESVRTHHVHIFQSGHPDLARHINFRDYMRAHPDDARAYCRLKRKLAKQFREDPQRYNEGKDEFIGEMDRRAVEWVRA